MKTRILILVAALVAGCAKAPPPQHHLMAMASGPIETSAVSFNVVQAADVPTPGSLAIQNVLGTLKQVNDQGVATSLGGGAGGSSGGTVTSVSGTAPISVATGTTTPVISIVASTDSVPGSMSAADKTKTDAVYRLKRGANLGDADVTLFPGSDQASDYWLPAGTLTTNRTITLGITGSVVGQLQSVSITRFDTSAFTLTIKDSGSTTQFTFPASPGYAAGTGYAARFYFATGSHLYTILDATGYVTLN